MDIVGVGRPLVVLKVGTSSLVDVPTLRPRLSVLSRLAEAVCALRAAGAAVIVVSSGAVGLGVSRLGLRERPAGLAGKQAAAAVGQVRLMSLYDHAFDAAGGTRVAQVLLTYDTFGERSAYLNARNTFAEVLRLGAVPIVNENDTVAVQELRVGDNDSLSALVAAMERAAGKAVPVVVGPRRAGDLPESYCLPDKAARVLGWRAERSLDDMCADAWRWQAANPMGYDTAPAE